MSLTLAQFVAAIREQRGFTPGRSVTMTMEDDVPPGLLERLAKLDRLGLLGGDALMSIIAQAPIDPLNLFATLQRECPAAWTFSAIDFGVVRVLARDGQGGVAAAVRIDLMDSSVTTMALNAAGQLTQHARYEPDGEPGKVVLEKIQRLCDDAVRAAARESSPAARTR